MDTVSSPYAGIKIDAKVSRRRKIHMLPGIPAKHTSALNSAEGPSENIYAMFDEFFDRIIGREVVLKKRAQFNTALKTIVKILQTKLVGSDESNDENLFMSIDVPIDHVSTQLKKHHDKSCHPTRTSRPPVPR